MKINEGIFKAYDIRGIFRKDLTPEIAEKIGKAFGTFIGRGKKIIVGRDVRLSGKILKNALVSGLISVGCDVVDADIVPSPLLYFAIVYKNLDGGIMITASHNPPEWNGFKFCKEKAILIGEGLGLEKVKKIVLNEKFNKNTRKGKVEKYNNIFEDYKKIVLNKIPISVGKKLKVVIDAVNSVSTLIAPKILEECGCEVITLNERLDGSFPSHLPEPNEKTLQELKEEVIKSNANLGLGFDGDADRVVFVDDKGRTLTGDIATMIFAKYYLKQRKNLKIVFDVPSSSAVEDVIRENGGIPLISRVGHTFMMDRIMKENAIFGGEISSHFYFSELYNLNDAMFAALKMVEILTKEKKKLSELVDILPKYFKIPIKEIECPDQLKLRVMEKVKEDFLKNGYNILDVDGIKVFDKDGWVLIRPSNTLPVIKINAEAKTEGNVKELFELGENTLKEEILKLS
jgi:phosphoglucosamine mutase